MPQNSRHPPNPPIPAGLAFRPAWDDEGPRALRLFPEAALAGAAASCFVAVRERPVERLVGAAFWREALGPDGMAAAEFRWRVLPALAGAEAERDFLRALADAVAGAGRAANCLGGRRDLR